MNTVKSQIFVWYLISYFRTFEKKVQNLILYESFFLLWGPCIATSFWFEALKGTKISSNEPVSRQKYENIFANVGFRGLPYKLFIY